MKENKFVSSIAEWCIKTFPQFQTREKLSLEILKEAVEVCQAAGVDPVAVLDVVSVQLSKPVSEPIAGEIADVYINLCNLVVHENLILDQIADDKMQINRLRFMKDEEIDTSDIPETRDWSNAVRGKFFPKGD